MRVQYYLKRFILFFSALALCVVGIGISYMNADTYQWSDDYSDRYTKVAQINEPQVWSEALLKSTTMITEKAFTSKLTNQDDYENILSQLIFSMATLLLLAMASGVVIHSKVCPRERLGDYTIRYIHNSVGYLQRFQYE